MLEGRRLDVLRAIVEGYVSTREPVGSRALVERHGLGVSPATIRNDMAALEEQGYITQPHTSAGRIPTDKGYRLFVDRLTAVRPLSKAERSAIETLLGGAVDLDEVVKGMVKLLAQLTRQVAVVQYPSLSQSSVRHIELVALGATRAMLVLITDTGRVEQRVVELPEVLSADGLADLRGRLNAAAVGVSLPEVPDRLSSLSRSVAPEDRRVAATVLSVLLEALVESREERIVLAGTANLARFGTDFPMTLSPVLEALEEQVVLLRLLGEATEPLTVRIGSENSLPVLTGTSVVSTGYGDGERVLAKIGVVGPTRMDYFSTMGAVRAVARYMGSILTETPRTTGPGAGR